MIKVNEEDFVKCNSVSGYDWSLFGNPKLTIQCGACGYIFSTREYSRITNVNNEIVALCRYC
jgi:hypothetical protein